MNNPKTFEEACLKVCVELAELVIRKHRGYGKDNILKFGEFGILVRASDKQARLENLIINKIPDCGETKEDNWKDKAGYSIVALLLNRGWFTLPLEEK